MDDLPIFRRHAAASRRIAVRAAIPLVCAVLVLLTSRTTADAQPSDPDFGPNEALVAGGPWHELTRLADAYWTRRGHRAFCPATLWIYRDSDPNTAAIGQMPGCNIGVNRTWLRWVRSTQRIADRYGGRAWIGGAHPTVGRAAIQREALGQVCLNVVHERGHNVGLDHSPDPHSVMYWRADRPPAECRAWAAANWRRFTRLSW
jgi:hypothetical protein